MSQINGSVLASGMYIWLTFEKAFTNELYCAERLREQNLQAVKKDLLPGLSQVDLDRDTPFITDVRAYE